MIPAIHALIGAVTDTRTRIAPIVRVVVLDEREVPIPRSQNPDWMACHLTYGACCADWMQPDDRTMTPEFVFSEFAVFYGFADSTVMEQAIAEFAKIDECAWAQAMVPTEPQSRPTWRLTALKEPAPAPSGA